MTPPAASPLPGHRPGKSPEPDTTAPEVPQVPRCHDEVCITCSDAAVPLRVRELSGDGLALADGEAGPEEISVALVDAHPGDVVLVHAGEAIAVVEEEG